MRMRSGLKFARMESLRALRASAINEVTSRKKEVAELAEGWEQLKGKTNNAATLQKAYKQRQYRSRSCIDHVIEIPVEKNRRGTWASADIARRESAVVGGHFLTDLPLDRNRRQSWLARAQHSLELGILPDSDLDEANRNDDPMSPEVHTILFPGHAITDVPRDKTIRNEWIGRVDEHAMDSAINMMSAGTDGTDNAIPEAMVEGEVHHEGALDDDESSDSGTESESKIRRSKTGIRLRAFSKRKARFASGSRQQRLTGYRLKQKLEMFQTPLWASVPCMRDVSSDVYPWQACDYCGQGSDDEGGEKDDEHDIEKMSALFLLGDTASSSQTRLRRAREHLRAVMMRKAVNSHDIVDKASLEKAKRERALVSSKSIGSRSHSYHSATEATRKGHLNTSEEPVLQILQRSADLKHRVMAEYESSQSIFTFRTFRTTTAGGKFGDFEL
ncbi:hypothetical protein Pmar_PMAR003702 [Perkinsus marinus ATCC 50983]|uniref:Uncharacterized protein n=1 Tax=Perkinsus marinus (strain ATCC 50983 / TXsc) TaxID=423536 RepID=C5KI27_PERM5|nr:hypothetical protein Pmar_PMAR003702 [Perkinsus marinus ATCC 50983]EER16239.1 hypothetical protein Pmar_PMAR003702 [Perkinsus marinus ATCC 50983]|eukprot:XP_002784443.1 hypothetical protein Pmar_PMAR003702 [Perkinsus marinus ATCC 50983]